MHIPRPAVAAAFFLACAVPAGAVPAWAAGGAGADAPRAAASRLEVAMTIYAGGITLGKVNMDATIKGDAYHVVSNLETSGVVNAFWQAQIQATSSGNVADGAFAPGLYDSFDLGHSGKKQEVSLSYTKGAPPRLFADPVYSTSGYEVKPQDQKGTLDPLSAVLYIVSGAGAEAGNPCGLTAPVFDGRRRYDIEIHKVRDIDIKMDNGLYRGKGLLCQIRYHQLSGFKPNVLKKSDSFPVINAWIATFKSGARDYHVPLRVWVDSKLYGVVAVLANSIRIDGQAPRS